MSVLQLTADRAAAWARIVALVRGEFAVEQVERYPTHLELWLEHPSVQLWFTGDDASIELPYWYTADPADAEAAVTALYRLALLVAAETGGSAVDHELGLPVDLGNVAAAVDRYCGVGEDVRELAALPPVLPTLDPQPGK